MLRTTSLRPARLSRALCAAGVATIAGASALHAQQGCRAVTPEALGSVNRFLNIPADMGWLAAHGITATDASTLTPLTMASNAATCVRIDSSFTTSPITAFRAGAYVIATESPVAADPVTGRIRMRETGHVLVFDTLGTFVYLPGTGVGPAIPLDLRITVATPGEVQLVWRNQSTSAVSYRLQRATGSGSFSDLGAALSPSDTSATDVSAADATTYRYRIAATGSDGGKGYTEEVTVGITDPGTVTRPIVGLLFRDTFNRADGAPGTDWVAESGTWAISGNALQINIWAGGSAVLRLAAVANRKDFHVQAIQSRSTLGTYAAIYARRVGTTLYLADLGSNTEHYGNPRMYRQTNGGYALLGYGTFVSTANTMQRLTYSVIGSALKLWANGALQISATDATAANDINGNVSLNVYGSGVAGTIRFDDLIVCSSRTVTMAGLPIGYRLRIGTIVSPKAVSGGAVSLDVMGTQLPVARVEVLDPQGLLVKTFAPTDGVWGGDRYSLNGAP